MSLFSCHFLSKKSLHFLSLFISYLFNFHVNFYYFSLFLFVIFTYVRTLGKIGTSDVADMMSCTIDAIAKNDYIDATRVAVVGGSHGGEILHPIMLCYDMLCYVMICYLILCHLMLCLVVLFFIVWVLWCVLVCVYAFVLVSVFMC